MLYRNITVSTSQSWYAGPSLRTRRGKLKYQSYGADSDDSGGLEQTILESRRAAVTGHTIHYPAPSDFTALHQPEVLGLEGLIKMSEFSYQGPPTPTYSLKETINLNFWYNNKDQNIHSCLSLVSLSIKEVKL